MIPCGAMPLQIRDPEVFGVGHDSLTLSFRVEDGAGPVDAAVRVLVDGEARAIAEGPGTRVVRLGGLPAGRALRLELVAPGVEVPPHDRYWPERVRTLPAPARAAPPPSRPSTTCTSASPASAGASRPTTSTARPSPASR